MKIEVRTVGDVQIVDCSGKITLGEGTMAIRGTVREALKAGNKNLVLNLGGVDEKDPGTVGHHQTADGVSGL